MSKLLRDLLAPRTCHRRCFLRITNCHYCYCTFGIHTAGDQTQDAATENVSPQPHLPLLNSKPHMSASYWLNPNSQPESQLQAYWGTQFTFYGSVYHKQVEMDVDCQVSKFATPVPITTETEHGSPVMSLSVITEHTGTKNRQLRRFSPAFQKSHSEIETYKKSDHLIYCSNQETFESERKHY